MILWFAVSAEVARLTVALADTDTNPIRSLRLAPFNPYGLTSAAMGEVGRAAAHGTNVAPATLERLQTALSAAPLEPDPFLVGAAIAERTGRLDTAASLLEQARLRNPRSAAARYLSADVLIRQNKIPQGLGEIAVLTRLLPKTSAPVVAALSEYAQSAEGRKKLLTALRSNPELKPPLLNSLASDPKNADLILAIAGADFDPAQWSQPWKRRLISSLVRTGDYNRAFTLWREFTGTAANDHQLLVNGNFEDVPPLPPFSWSYKAGSVGVAEPENGKLHVVYYGKENATLASQLLLLSAGKYRFYAPAVGNAAGGSLLWTLTCLSNRNQIMEFDFTSGSSAAAFTVPASCSAQELRLSGRGQDTSQGSDVEIGPVRLESLSG